MLEEKRDKLAAELAQLEAGMNALEGTEGRILRAHYMQGHSWQQVALDEGYEQAQIFRIYSSAVRKLEGILMV